MDRHTKEWTLDRLEKEVKNYSSRSVFHDKCRDGYNFALKNNLLNKYFGETKHIKKFPANFWTKELAIEESKKYKTKAEFRKRNQYVYNLSVKKGWIEEMNSLRSFRLTKKECFERAKKYSSVKDFNANDTRAYQKSLENGWLKEMDWLEPTNGTASNPFWTFEKIKEVASLCKSRYEFSKKYPGAYGMAKKKGWYDKLDLPKYVIKEKVYCVYSYDWDEQMVSYVGLTYRKKERDDEHHGKGKYIHSPYKSIVYKFATENNLSIPEPKYYGENLSLSDAQELEDKIKNEHIACGYNVLNKGKTGVGIGSYGNVGIKWSYENVYNEAIKYKTSGEFYKNSIKAYNAAYEHGWLKKFNWMKFGNKMSVEEAIERTKNYKNRKEFYTYEKTAYSLLRKNNPTILDEIFGKLKNRRLTIDECVEIAKEYSSRSKLASERSGVYEILRKNGMLDKIFPIKLKNQFE